MAIIKKILVFLSFFIIFIAMGFYTYHLYKYPSDLELSKNMNYLREYYPDEFIMRAGGRLKRPESRNNHFLKFAKKKEEGTIRIGIFGDSYTFGSEVHKKASYPSQLQTLLNNHFLSKKIEVLNFGNGGHGFQEQFFLWEKYAKLYKIDYVLYGPRGFYPDRDLTFQKNWTYKITDFYFPKSRFILSGKNKLYLVSIKGSSPKENYINYYTLFPSFTALRYDKYPFQLWESYFPFLRKKLTNPFYYSDLPEHIESKEINQTLLKKIDFAYNKKILLLTSDKSFFKMYQDIKPIYNLNLFNIPNKSLYRVFGHYNSLGYEITAHIYLHALMGKPIFNLNTLSCRFNRKKGAPLNSTEDINLNNVKKIFIGTKNIYLREAKLNSSDHYFRKKGASFFQYKPENIKSLIGFSDTSINDYGLSPYFPISFTLSNKSAVFIHFSNGERISLGQIKELDTHKKFFNFYSSYLKIKLNKTDSYYEVHFLKEKFPQNLKEKLLQNINKKPYLLIDDYVLGELSSDTYYERESSLALKPYPKTSFLMMGPQHLVKERQLPLEFPLYIHYIMEDNRILKSLIPDWSCHKEKHTYKLELPNFEPLKNNSL